MYSGETMDRQWEQAREVLLAMKRQCGELVIDCLQELNSLYDSGIPSRERSDDDEEEN